MTALRIIIEYLLIQNDFLPTERFLTYVCAPWLYNTIASKINTGYNLVLEFNWKPACKKRTNCWWTIRYTLLDQLFFYIQCVYIFSLIVNVSERKHFPFSLYNNFFFLFLSIKHNNSHSFSICWLTFFNFPSLPFHHHLNPSLKQSITVVQYVLL